MGYTIQPGDTDIVGTLTRILADIDVRLTRAQGAADTLPATEREFRTSALQRLFSDLAPLIEQLRARVQRGVLTATSDTEVLLVAGVERSWIVADADRQSFAPSPFLLATRRLSPTDTALLRLVDWDPAVGILTAEVVEIEGSPGPHADWEFVSGPGVVYAQRAWLAEGRTSLAEIRAAVLSTQTSAESADSAAERAEAAAEILEQAVADGPVTNVNGMSGAVTLAASDVGAYSTGQVDQKLGDLKGTADAQHDTLGELAVLVDANSAALGAKPDLALVHAMLLAR